MNHDHLHRKISQSLKEVSNEAKELYLDKHVPVIEGPVDPLNFYRHFVGPNKPVLIKGAVEHWPAFRKWDSDYLRNSVGDTEVTVAVTENGYADAVSDGKFVCPEDRKMLLSKFLDILKEPEKHNGIFYIQQQNSNLTGEFSAIINDVEPHIPWGTQAFGKFPDAVNFWMGDSRAVTSMHRDHYENLYCVVKGWKKFILIPPTDLPFVPYGTYPRAQFRELPSGKFVVDDLEGEVQWVSIDPLDPDLDKYPQFSNAMKIEVTVKAGDMLYLPSLWFHHVRQSHGCIAVNYWYDMEFDIKYNYYKFLENITSLVS